MKETKPHIKRALLSVSDKSGLVSIGQKLADLGVDIIATGGTATRLKEANIPVISVESVTQFPEMMAGRVKTLHPAIHGALLGRRDTDQSVMHEHGIVPIDLVIVNLYPFEKTVAHPDCTLPEAIEQIDIGGPSMLRSAAKNHQDVTVVIDPNDYGHVLSEIETLGHTTLTTRQQLAQKVFAHTAAYDAAIADYLSQAIETQPQQKTITLTHQADLRYGENPQQAAVLYTHAGAPAQTLAKAQQLQGKPLSFNNLMDGQAALSTVALWTDMPACVIVKHATPCGVGQAATALSAYEKALATDPVSAFGGIIAFNCPVDAQTATHIIEKQFAEVIIAPAIEPAAQAVFEQKPNCRLLILGDLSQASPESSYHSISGGLLIQTADYLPDAPDTFTVVTERAPTEAEWADCLFAWKAIRHVKSNAILYAKDKQTLGIGTGQTSRVFSARIAILKAEEAGLSLQGASAASDAFLPFPDTLEVAASAGITALIQPGGSKNDPLVIEAANRLGIAMICTHQRHFKH